MIQELTENLQMELCVILKKAYQDCYQKWQQHWERCISAGGEYFEGDKAHSVAGLSEKIIKKIVPKLFEQTTYVTYFTLILRDVL
jgi:hypothetical protein